MRIIGIEEVVYVLQIYQLKKKITENLLLMNSVFLETTVEAG